MSVALEREVNKCQRIQFLLSRNLSETLDAYYSLVEHCNQFADKTEARIRELEAVVNEKEIEIENLKERVKSSEESSPRTQLTDLVTKTKIENINHTTKKKKKVLRLNKKKNGSDDNTDSLLKKQATINDLEEKNKTQSEEILQLKECIRKMKLNNRFTLESKYSELLQLNPDEAFKKIYAELVEQRSSNDELLVELLNTKKSASNRPDEFGKVVLEAVKSLTPH